MGETLPAKTSPALALRDTLPTPADLEGWDSDDVAAGLQVVVTNLNERRLIVGLLLWKFRALNVDAVYSDKQAEVAQACDVDVRTLQRWRVFAEKKWALPPPDRRTEGQRAGAEVRQRGLSTGEAMQDKGSERERHGMSLANSREQEPEPEKVAPDAVSNPTPPEPPTAPPKPSQQLSLWEERETRPFLPSRPPASREEADAAKALGHRILEWGSMLDPEPAKRENAYVARPTHQKRASESTKTSKAKREKCHHPVSRRIGDSCAACGQKVTGK